MRGAWGLVGSRVPQVVSWQSGTGPGTPVWPARWGTGQQEGACAGFPVPVAPSAGLRRPRDGVRTSGPAERDGRSEGWCAGTLPGPPSDVAVRHLSLACSAFASLSLPAALPTARHTGLLGLDGSLVLPTQLLSLPPPGPGLSFAPAAPPVFLGLPLALCCQTWLAASGGSHCTHRFLQAPVGTLVPCLPADS